MSATPASTRARARRGEGERLREEIIEAVERLLVRTPDVDAISIRAIADEVGVTPPSIYRHFPDKERLVYEVVARHFATLDELMETESAPLDGSPEELYRRLYAYVRFGLENPEPYRVLFMCKGGEMPPKGDATTMPGQTAFTHLVDAVQRAMDAGSLRPDLDPFLAAVGLWTSVHGVTSLLISHPDFPWPDLEQILDHVCARNIAGLAREIDH